MPEMKPSGVVRTLIRVRALLSPRQRKELWFWLIAKTAVAIIDFLAVAGLGAVLVSTSSTLADTEVLGILSRFPKPGSTGFLLLLLLVLALFMIKTMLFFLVTRGFQLYLARIETEHSVAVAESVFAYKLEGLQNFSEAELQWAVNRSTQIAFSNFLGVVIGLVADLATSSMILFLFLFTNPVLATVLGVYFASLFFAFQFFTNDHLRRKGIQLRDSQIELTGVIHSIPLAYREMIVMQREAFFLEKLRTTKQATTTSQAHYTVISSLPRQFFEIGLISGVLLVLFASLQLNIVLLDPLTFGVFAAGTLRLMGLFLPLQRGLSNLVFIAPQARESLQILEKEPDTSAQPEQDASERTPLGLSTESPGNVTLTNVRFQHPDGTSEVLKGVSLEVLPGEFVVVSGDSGAGKSTLLDVVLGLRAPTLGNVKVGIPESSSQLVPTVRFVSQSVGIIPGTILENISLGGKATDMDLRRALEVSDQVGLAQVFAGLPDGLHSDLGKHAEKLSGGQLQRLSLARALFDSPQILVLDEPTSALDVDSERAIGELLLGLKKFTTIIAVSHRPHLMGIADRRFLLADGLLHEIE